MPISSLVFVYQDTFAIDQVHDLRDFNDANLPIAFTDLQELIEYLKTQHEVRDFKSYTTNKMSFKLKERIQEAKEVLQCITKCWNAYKDDSPCRELYPFLLMANGMRSIW